MKTERLVGITMCLLARKRVSAQALAAQFEVSLRTIYRDMEAIGMAGIPVRAVPGVGGGFEILPSFKLDHTVFSSADLAALLAGLSGLSALTQRRVPAEVLAKLRRLMPEEEADAITAEAARLRIDVRPWLACGSTPPYPETVQTALREQRLLAFSYTDHRGNVNVRSVEPYQLIWKSGCWYLYGYCRLREDFRLFRLSRMTGLRLCAETFAPRAHPEPTLELATPPDAEPVRLRIRRDAAEQILDFCSRECFTPDGAAHDIVEFPFVGNDYAYGRLLSLGTACECLSPPHIRAELRRRALEIAAQYAE